MEEASTRETFPEVKEATEKFEASIKAAMAAGIPTTMEEIRKRAREVQARKDETRRRRQMDRAAAETLSSKHMPSHDTQELTIPYLKSRVEAAKVDGVYADASWSTTKKTGKIAVVKRTKDGVDASLRKGSFESSEHAERAAIQLALDRYPIEDVYSDSQGAVRYWNAKGVSRVHWIPRHQNKVADSLTRTVF